MNKVATIICICLILATGLVGFGIPNAKVVGQGAYQPFVELDAEPFSAQWSPDSTSFVFQYADQGVLTDSDSWLQYNIGRKKLTATNKWPLQTSLTPAQQQAFEVVVGTAGQSASVFISPNRRYIVYASRQDATELPGYALGVADLQTNEHKILYGIAVESGLFNLDYWVKWSANSAALVVQVHAGPVSYAYYVTNFAAAIASTTTIYLDKGLPYFTKRYEAFVASDISADGRWLLLYGDYSSDYGSNLFLWDTQNLAKGKSLVRLDGVIVEAVFVPGTRYKIRFVGASGLTEYDVNTGTRIILDANINSTWVRRAWISPDGTKIVFVHDGKSIQLYAAGIDKPLSTPFATPSLF